MPHKTILPMDASPDAERADAAIPAVAFVERTDVVLFREKTGEVSYGSFLLLLLLFLFLEL